MSVDTTVREALHADAYSFEADTAAAFAELEVAARRSTARRTGLILAGTAALLAAGIVWGPALVDSLSGAPDIEPVGPPAPVDEPAGLDWARVDVDRVLDLGGTVPAGDGFVGTQRNPAGGSMVVTSPDGATWSEPEGAGLQDGEWMAWLDGGQWGAVGNIRGPEGGWQTEDLLFTTDGTRFERSTVPVESFGHDMIRGAAVGEAGVLVGAASGPPPGGGATTLLFSADLQAWQPVEIDAPASVQHWVPVASPIGFLALGAVDDAPENHPIVAYYSTDGRDWQQMSLPEGRGDVVAATGWRDGFVLSTRTTAPGDYMEGEPLPEVALWSSTDGQTFTGMDATLLAERGEPGLDGSSLGVVAVAGASWVTPDQSSVLLFSPDGETWHSESTLDLVGWADLNRDAVVVGEDAVVVTVLSDEETPTGTQLWIGAPAEQ